MIQKDKLENLYHRYNRRKYVHPDPLEFLYAYKDLKDREVAGLVASSLAYGRVAQILKSVSLVLSRMGPSPAAFLETASAGSFQSAFSDFTHRFASGAHLSALLMAAKQIIRHYGSLYDCFISGLNTRDETVFPALALFAEKLSATGRKSPGHLIPFPERGSACKRLNLFLRWMVRKDRVDPGGWENVSLSKLVVPLDVHMHRISLALGLTSRLQPDRRTALEVTEGFKKMAPEDPVRYDFSLTRLGIRNDTDWEAFLNS